MINPLDLLFIIIGIVGVLLVIISIFLYLSVGHKLNPFNEEMNKLDAMNILAVGVGLIGIVLFLIGLE